MCLVVDLTPKFNLIQYKINLQLNQFELLLIQLQNTFLIQIFKKILILVSNCFQCISFYSNFLSNPISNNIFFQGSLLTAGPLRSAHSFLFLENQAKQVDTACNIHFPSSYAPSLPN